MSHQVAGALGRIGNPEAILRQATRWGTQRDAEVLLADAQLVFGRDHLESAVLHANRAKALGAMSAHSLPVETLRYLTGQRQVSDAIRIGGLHDGTTQLAVVIFGNASIDELLAEFGWVRDDAVLDATGKSVSRLGVSAREASTVPRNRKAELALEKVALVDVTK